jgi:hypothetical protein
VFRYIEIFISVDTIISYKNIQIYTIYIKILKHDMFRPLLGYHQVYCWCLGAELLFNIDPYFAYYYITCNIMLGNKILGIIYFLVQLYWN